MPQPTYEELQEQVDQLRQALEHQMRLPVPRADGIEMALEGLSLEITRLVNAKHRLSTFETVGKIAGLAHQVYLLSLLLRDLTMDDLADAEDMFPDDVQDQFRQHGQIIGGPMMNPYAEYYGNGGIRIGNRVRRARRRQARQRQAREGRNDDRFQVHRDRDGGLEMVDNHAERPLRVDDLNEFGARRHRRGRYDDENPDPYHHAQGFHRRQDDEDEPNYGLGAPYNAWAGDLRDEPGNPVPGFAGMMNGIVEVMERATGRDRERERVEGMFRKAQNLGGVIRDLKRERNDILTEHGDDHEELAALNARITKFKAQRSQLLEDLAALNAEQHVDEVDDTDVPDPPTVHDYLPRPPGPNGRQQPQGPQPPLANHECTKCDQVQGPYWRDEDGDPMPCDVCGAPMKRVESKAEVRHDEHPGNFTAEPPLDAAQEQTR